MKNHQSEENEFIYKFINEKPRMWRKCSIFQFYKWQKHKSGENVAIFILINE